MNYLFTICGRAGSKGLANKNVSTFCGLPLVYYTLSAIALTAKQLEQEGNPYKVALNTDSDQLAELVNSQHELEILHINRESCLAGDHVPKVTVIENTLVRAEKYWGCTFDYVIDLDITSPMRTCADILKAIRVKEERAGDTDVVYSLSPARKNPYFNMAKLVDGYYEKVIHANYISRQETPKVYDMNASIYVYEPKALRDKEPTGFFNDHADAIIMKDTAVLDIDCLEDKEMMEVLAKYYFFVKFDEYKEIYEHAKGLDKHAKRRCGIHE